jgi:hypothetical protein
MDILLIGKRRMMLPEFRNIKMLAGRAGIESPA